MSSPMACRSGPQGRSLKTVELLLSFWIVWPPAFLGSLSNGKREAIRATKLAGSAKCCGAKFSSAHPDPPLARGGKMAQQNRRERVAF